MGCNGCECSAAAATQPARMYTHLIAPTVALVLLQEQPTMVTGAVVAVALSLAHEQPLGLLGLQSQTCQDGECSGTITHSVIHNFQRV